MTVLALIFGIVALVVFIIEGVRSRALIPWGLAAFVAMVMAQWLIEGGDTVTL